MAQGIDRQQIAEFGQSLQGDMANAGTRLDVLHTTLARLNEERQVLSTAIDALESKGATSIAKDTLINADKVLSLGMQPPELAVIMLALEQMKATLDKVLIDSRSLSLGRVCKVTWQTQAPDSTFYTPPWRG
ncbi:hypothetical protein BKM09_007785 [Pseudomonas amygdali pv. morsprunorum]|nr:alpha-xenorhabdolysin family binary toxin subunit B [Pseudomonas amygdali]POY78797.1 hypothetical protein BKM09_007785 [Pseudomonas amygdali pv. morsprunorum]